MAKRVVEEESSENVPSRLLTAAIRRAADGVSRMGRRKPSEILAAIEYLKTTDLSKDDKRSLDELAAFMGLIPVLGEESDQ